MGQKFFFFGSNEKKGDVPNKLFAIEGPIASTDHTVVNQLINLYRLIYQLLESKPSKLLSRCWTSLNNVCEIKRQKPRASSASESWN